MAALSLVAAACGGDGGNGPSNNPPTANFEPPPCTLLDCTFTDASTDDGEIDSRSWTFENGTPATSTAATQAVTFAAAGTHTVTLTVTDNEGATDDFSREVTVGSPPGDPTAAFSVDCNSLECSFTDGSTDDGDIASYAWDFGDPTSPDNTSDLADPTHTYSFQDITEVTVRLTVTDDEGNTGETSETFNVSPPAGLTCDGADCVLTLESAASVTVTLISSMCQASGNTFVILTPVLDTLFTDGCNTPVPGTPEATFELQNGEVFAAGTEITAEVISGLPNQALPPTIRVTQGFPEWKLEFDDGFVGPEEPQPDFNDLVLTVTANP
jgi:PKD repeat protein